MQSQWLWLKFSDWNCVASFSGIELSVERPSRPRIGTIAHQRKFHRPYPDATGRSSRHIRTIRDLALDQARLDKSRCGVTEADWWSVLGFTFQPSEALVRQLPSSQ
jgi:hypothetical protein